jgi:hypothetical protein
MNVSATTPSNGARRTVFAAVSRASGARPRHRGPGGPAGRVGALGLARGLVEDVGRDDSLRREAGDPLALALGPFGGQAGLVALGGGGGKVALGDLELRLLQRVVDAEQHLPLVDPASPPVGEGDHPAPRLGGELRPATGLHRARAGVRDRLLDSAFLRGHDADGQGRGSEDGEPEDHGEADEGEDGGEAGPEAADGHDVQPPPNCPAKGPSRLRGHGQTNKGQRTTDTNDSNGSTGYSQSVGLR